MRIKVLAVIFLAVIAAACGGAQVSTPHAGTIAPANPATHPPYAPTATPTAVPTLTPTAAPATAPPAVVGTTARPTAPPAPTVYRNRVIGPGVNVSIVGTYTDCTGKAAVGWAGAYFDSCFPAPWIMAHPTFFGGMNGWGIGTAVTWWDGNAVPHTYHIIDITVYPPGSTGVRVNGSAHFQVCTQNIVNSTVRVLNAA